jgi:hypothetical protein
VLHRLSFRSFDRALMEQLWAGTGSASLEWGDMLVVLLKGGLVVTDASVVHSVATSFV